MKLRWPFVWKSKYERDMNLWKSALQIAELSHREERDGLFKQLRESMSYMNETKAVWEPGAHILQVTMSVTSVGWGLTRFREELLHTMFKEMVYKIEKTTGYINK